MKKLLLIVPLILMFFALQLNVAKAGADIPLSGWSWSSNIGWISFSSLQGGGGPYGVTMATTSGSPTVATLKGYAWSSNIGWIKFDGLSGYPAGGTGTNAKVDLTPNSPTLGQVSGWVRACAGTVNAAPNANKPGNCSSMNSRTDGWDGWIELSGANHPSPDPNNPTGTSKNGVFFNTKTGYFSGYAWGGSVVGWIQFNPKTAVGGSDPDIGVKVPCEELPEGCPDGGGELSISCEGSYNSSNGKITWKANIITKGKPPYQYSWNGNAGTNTRIVGPFYSGDTAQTMTLKVTDKDGAEKSFTCPSITPNGVNTQLELRMGTTASNMSGHRTPTSALLVRTGSHFKLEWTNSLTPGNSTTGYDCAAFISPANPDLNKWTDPVQTDVTSSSLIPLELSTKKTGLYQFKIDCPYLGNPSLSTSTSSYLKIGSVSEGEF